MIKEFEAGKTYQQSKEAEAIGPIHALADGKPHRCIRGHGTSASFDTDEFPALMTDYGPVMEHITEVKSAWTDPSGMNRPEGGVRTLSGTYHYDPEAKTIFGLSTEELAFATYGIIQQSKSLQVDGALVEMLECGAIGVPEVMALATMTLRKANQEMQKITLSEMFKDALKTLSENN